MLCWHHMHAWYPDPGTNAWCMSCREAEEAAAREEELKQKEEEEKKKQQEDVDIIPAEVPRFGTGDVRGILVRTFQGEPIHQTKQNCIDVTHNVHCSTSIFSHALVWCGQTCTPCLTWAYQWTRISRLRPRRMCHLSVAARSS